MNSMVLAAAANTKLLVEGQIEGGCDLAERAVRVNPANPFAWDALSTAALHFGQLRRAHLYALKAQRIGVNSPFKHWWDMGCCLTATVSGDHDMARSCAMTAHALAPEFRPPLRYLIALHAASGDVEQARAAVQRLRRMEVNFSTDQMFGDTQYPIAALRKSHLDLDQLRSVLA
jgi:Flp pilus assembly protein TadD